MKILKEEESFWLVHLQRKLEFLDLGTEFLMLLRMDDVLSLAIGNS